MANDLEFAQVTETSGYHTNGSIREGDAVKPASAYSQYEALNEIADPNASPYHDNKHGIKDVDENTMSSIEEALADSVLASLMDTQLKDNGKDSPDMPGVGGGQSNNIGLGQ